MFLSLLLALLTGCQEAPNSILKDSEVHTVGNSSGIIRTNGTTIATRFAPPKGYSRIGEASDAYSTFLRDIELKPHGSLVHLYDGREKNNKVAEAVLKYDVGSYDLQQCADAVMRIRAEYLFKNKRYDDIHFNFTNGFKANYNRWMQGERISIQSNTCKWIKSSSRDTSYGGFRKYLHTVYSYAGSLSLSKELAKVSSLQEMQPGDVFIIGGTPGHAVTVMDVATNQNGEKVFILSQSYMPAQDIHVLKNLNNPDISPWYRVKDIKNTLETPEYTFEPHHLMRFKDE